MARTIRNIVAGKSKFSPTPGNGNSPNSPRRSSPSPSPPKRTQSEINKIVAVQIANQEANRLRRMRNAIEEAAELNRWKERVKKVRLENEARWIAAAIKKQKNQNNRLAAAAAVNLNNAKSLNKVFKNNKTVLGRLRRLVGRLRR